jgi:hypothetical protein
MGRYGRCLRRYWATSLAVEAEYRLNLLLEVLSVAGNLAGSLLLLTLFTDHGHSLGGWSWPAALVVLGVHTLLDGLSTSLLQPNLSTIVRHVQTGTLDYLLLQPLDSQFQVSLRVLSPWGLPAAMAGLGLIVTGLVQAGAAPGLDLHPALAVLRKLEDRGREGKRRLARGHPGQALALVAEVGLEVFPEAGLERGLVVEEVELRGRADERDVDRALGLGRDFPRLRHRGA